MLVFVDAGAAVKAANTDRAAAATAEIAVAQVELLWRKC